MLLIQDNRDILHGSKRNHTINNQMQKVQINTGVVWGPSTFLNLLKRKLFLRLLSITSKTQGKHYQNGLQGIQ